MRGGPIKTLKIGFIIIFVAAVGTYAAFETRNLLDGPTISVESPADGSTVSGEIVAIRGTAKNVSFLSFNGRQIYTDTAGVWNEGLLVPEGYTIIELKASDRFNREVTQHIRIIRKDSASS